MNPEIPPMPPQQTAPANSGGAPAVPPAAPVEPVPASTAEADALVLDIASDELVADKRKTTGGGSFFDMINDYMIENSTVPLKDKLLFFQLLSAMIGAGLPITEGLDLLYAQMKNPKMKVVIKTMRGFIEEGDSLAEALRKNGDVFDEATCAVVEAGEKSGKLNDVMKELVEQQEQLDELTKKIKSVMTYPVVVIITMALLGVVVLIFVVPKLVDIFGGAENLPLPTRIMIFASDFMRNSWLLLLMGLGAAVFGFLSWKKSKAGARQWGVFLISIPVVGPILRDMILNRVTRIFGFLISSGVPVVEGLKMASHIAENDLYREKLLLAADDLTKGISIAENLADDEKLFPPMLINMMSIGEKTASLDVVMGKAADFYQMELDRKVGMMSKLLEPFILAFIAGGAVFMILAIYMPILQMNDQVIGS